MGYQDDFYIPRNIVGYTGDLHGVGRNAPTVYFCRFDYGVGYTFGRITQYHENEDNIGRNKVRTHHDYWVGNKWPEGYGVEFYNGRVRHQSRNRMYPVSWNNIRILMEAIYWYPYRKSK